MKYRYFVSLGNTDCIWVYNIKTGRAKWIKKDLFHKLTKADWNIYSLLTLSDMSRDFLTCKELTRKEAWRFLSDKNFNEEFLDKIRNNIKYPRESVTVK